MNRVGALCTFATATCLAVGLTSPDAAARPEHHVAWSKMQMGNWTFTPIYSAWPGEPSVMHSFLALANPSSLTGDNLAAVWYILKDGDIITKSWKGADAWTAIMSVKSILGIPDDEDERWDVPGAPAVQWIPDEPLLYTKGVLEIDEMSPTVLAATPLERDTIVSFLTSIGYKSAAVPAENDDGCTLEIKLYSMAAAMAATLGEGDIVQNSKAAWLASGAAGCGIGSLVDGIISRPVETLSPPGWWSTPVWNCTTSRGLSESCTTQSWTEGQLVTQDRIRWRCNPTPPAVCELCDESRLGTRERVTECKHCVDGVFPVDCPPAPPIGMGIPETCSEEETRIVTTRYYWSQWVANPPCSF